MGTDIKITKKVGVKNQDTPITTDTSNINFKGAGVNATVVGSEVTVTITGSGSGGATNLSYIPAVNDGIVTSDTGTNATIPLADATNAGLFSAIEKAKLAGIQAGAEVNVNADWLATSGLAQILNKPTSIPTANVAHAVKYAEALTIGQAVYVSGADGTNMLVSKASNTSEATSSKTLGLVTASGAANYQGEVITEGLLSGLNTSTATIGDAVWLGTAGNLIFWHYGLTTKPVAPAHLVFIGVVTRVSATVGEIFVKPQNGFEIDELHDVLIVNPANNQVIAYDIVTGLWKNKDLLNITTIGTSGVATLSGNTLNIPAYKTMIFIGDFIGGDAYNDGDIVNFNNDLYICILSIGSAITPNTDPTHWSLFVDGITLTTTGTSGAATLVGSTLNIPQYNGGGGNTTLTALKPSEIFRGFTFNNNSTAFSTVGGVTGSTTGVTLAQSVSSGSLSFKQIRLKFYNTTVSTGRYTGIRGSALLWFITGGFRFVSTFSVGDTSFSSSCQNFHGMAGQTGDITYGDAGNVQLSTMTNIIGIGSEGSDTTLQVFHNDSTGTCTKIDLGVNFPSNRTNVLASEEVYSIVLYNEPNTTSVTYWVKNLLNGIIATGVVSTNLPASFTGLNFFASRTMGSPSVTGSGQINLSQLGVYSQ